MNYIIYESAVESPIGSVVSNGNVVEFTATLQEADVKNRNGRIYPKQVIMDGIKNPVIQEKLRTHTLFGECGHPYSQDLARQTNVDMRNAAFMIESFWWEGNLLKGKCKTLDTACGRDMAGLIKEGCQLSFSMRGQGQVARDSVRDALVVKSPLMILTYDWVWLPSHNVAYMDKVNTFASDTKESMFKVGEYATESMALNESCSLYENGMIFELGAPKKEKPIKDYFAGYGNKFNVISEAYRYDPKDVLKEDHGAYVMLEGADCMKKVAKEDYLLKSIRKNMLESSCSGIACPDVKASDAEKRDLRKVVKSGVEVKPTGEAVDQMNEDRLGEDIENESATEPNSPLEKAAKECGFKDGVSGEDDASVLAEPAATAEEPDESVDGLTSEKADAAAKKHLGIDDDCLKKEASHICGIITDETGLTEMADIAKVAMNYKEFMSEDCARLFERIAEED